MASNKTVKYPNIKINIGGGYNIDSVFNAFKNGLEQAGRLGQIKDFEIANILEDAQSSDYEHLINVVVDTVTVY